MKHIMLRANEGQFRRGENHPLAKLTAAEVLEIRRLYQESDITQKALARKFGVTRSTVWRVINRLSWNHI